MLLAVTGARLPIHACCYKQYIQDGLYMFLQMLPCTQRTTLQGFTLCTTSAWQAQLSLAKVPASCVSSDCEWGKSHSADSKPFASHYFRFRHKPAATHHTQSGQPGESGHQCTVEVLCALLLCQAVLGDLLLAPVCRPNSPNSKSFGPRTNFGSPPCGPACCPMFADPETLAC